MSALMLMQREILVICLYPYFSPNVTFTSASEFALKLVTVSSFLALHTHPLAKVMSGEVFKGNVIDQCTVEMPLGSHFSSFCNFSKDKLSSSIYHDFHLCSKTYLKMLIVSVKVFLTCVIQQVLFKLFLFRSREHRSILIIFISSLATNYATIVHHDNFYKLHTFTISRVPGNFFY